MKKLIIITLVAILAVSLAACGKRKDENKTEPTNDTMPTILDPTILDPTFETNIPDPSVDTSMPTVMDPTVSGDTTGK